MNTVVPFEEHHLEQATWLVNAHLASAVAGWAIPAPYLAARLRRDPGEYVVDPWVAERRTLVALLRERVVAAAHIHRFGESDRVDPQYRGAGEVAWLLAWPDAAEAGSAVLGAALEQFEDWSVTRRYADNSLYVPSLGGVPDVWPHVAAILRAGGFEPTADRSESVYGGTFDDVPRGMAPPVAGLSARRRVSNHATRFEALLDGETIGHFDVATDCSDAGRLPSLRGWADAWDFEVVERLRSRGIGSWLVSHGVEWLTLAGCSRIVLPVAAAGEDAGAGRFYERLGWRKLVTLERGWVVP